MQTNSNGGHVNEKYVVMSTSARLFRQAEAIKADVTEGTGDTWTTRQKLQNVYQQLLIADLEYALDKKVEQDLWNYAFKNQINSLQIKVKDKANPKRHEVQANLSLFLEAASGFYLQLLQELCSAFHLDFPCHVKSSRLGILNEQNPNHRKIVQPQVSSCHYICQHCLVHLGDIARYRNQNAQAHTYYQHAAHLVPSNGQPYNQLAILAAGKGDQLATVFYYVRSIAVKHPFPASVTNLQMAFTKMIDKDELKTHKITPVELIFFFIQFHALIYLAADLQRAANMKDKLVEHFKMHINQESFTSQQLVQIVVINLFALHHIKNPEDHFLGENGEGGDTKQMCYSGDEDLSWNLVFSFNMSLLSLLLHFMPAKSEQKARDHASLAAIKLILDWLVFQPGIFTDPIVQEKSYIWPKLAKIMNTVQHKDKLEESLTNIPSPEDYNLQAFMPLAKAHSILDFMKGQKMKVSDDILNRLRIERLLDHGKWLHENVPSVMKVERKPNAMKKLRFLSPYGLKDERNEVVTPQIQIQPSRQPTKQKSEVKRDPTPVQKDTNLVVQKNEDAVPENGVKSPERRVEIKVDTKTQSVAVQAMPKKDIEKSVKIVEEKKDIQKSPKKGHDKSPKKSLDVARGGQKSRGRGDKVLTMSSPVIPAGPSPGQSPSQARRQPPKLYDPSAMDHLQVQQTLQQQQQQQQNMMQHTGFGPAQPRQQSAIHSTLGQPLRGPLITPNIQNPQPSQQQLPPQQQNLHSFLNPLIGQNTPHIQGQVQQQQHVLQQQYVHQQQQKQQQAMSQLQYQQQQQQHLQLKQPLPHQAIPRQHMTSQMGDSIPQTGVEQTQDQRMYSYMQNQLNIPVPKQNLSGMYATNPIEVMNPHQMTPDLQPLTLQQLGSLTPSQQALFSSMLSGSQAHRLESQREAGDENMLDFNQLEKDLKFTENDDDMPFPKFVEPVDSNVIQRPSPTMLGMPFQGMPAATGETFPGFQDSSSSNLFPTASDLSEGGMSGSYSLFNTPWTASESDGLNLTSSPFSSRSASSHTSPRHSPLPESFGGSLGLGWGSEPATWASTSTAQLSSSPTSTLLPSNIQSIWSSPPVGSGLTPLEQLLQQQQQQRNT